MPHFETFFLQKLSQEWFHDCLDISLKIVTALVIFAAFFLVAKFAQKALRSYTRNKEPHVYEVAKLISKILRIALILIGTVTALGTAGVNVGALVTSLGLTGFALSLAFKDVLTNVLSGMLILLYRPFRIGDTITIASHTGKIMLIDLRYTTLKKDNERILIPNAMLLSGTIRVQESQ